MLTHLAVCRRVRRPRAPQATPVTADRYPVAYRQLVHGAARADRWRTDDTRTRHDTCGDSSGKHSRCVVLDRKEFHALAQLPADED